MYDGILPTNTPQDEIPNYLFGAYNMSVTLFNLIPALTTTFGVSALPAVTAAWAARSKSLLRRNIESVWRVTSMIAFPAGFGICALAEPILTLVYQADPASIPIAAPILRVLGLAAVFVALSSPTNSMLQAVGKVNVPVKLMLLGGFLKLAVNFVLVPIPAVNIQGAPYGTLLCWADCLYFDSGAVQDSGNPDSIHKSVFKTSFCWCSLRCYRMGKLWTTFQSGRKYRFHCHIYPAGRRSVRDCIIFGAGNCEI